jgi:hypothetical protein
MSPEAKPEIRLEIGHVLFIDIVAYSKLLISEQSEQLQKLKEIVWGNRAVPACSSRRQTPAPTHR